MNNNNVITNSVTAREFPVEAFYGSIMMRDNGVYMLDDDGNVRQFIALADAMAYRAWLWPDVYKIDREVAALCVEQGIGGMDAEATAA